VPGGLGTDIAEERVTSNAEPPFGRLIQSTILNRRLDMKRTLIVGVALALAPAFALAAGDKKDKSAASGASMTTAQADFSTLDKNKDGNLSQDELKGQSGVTFSTVDKDGDGKISAQEWSDHQKGAAGPAGPAGTPGAAGTSSGTGSSMSGSSTSTPSSSSTAPSTTPPASSSSTDTTKKQ
jgi:hypothetical protein